MFHRHNWHFDTYKNNVTYGEKVKSIFVSVWVCHCGARKEAVVKNIK